MDGKNKALEPLAEGCGIVMAGYAGDLGAAILAKEKESELRERFPAFLIRNALAFRKDRITEPLNRWFSDKEDAAMYRRKAGEGGVFKALWNLGETAGTGFTVDLKRIPIRQETVEICNELAIDPYILLTGGVWLMLPERGEKLAAELEREGIPAAVIGWTHREKKRVVRYDEEERFIEPRRQDALLEVPGMKLPDPGESSGAEI